jgi:hypothetical protein
MERVLVSPETVTVLGYKVKAGRPIWEGLFMDRAEPATQSTLMLAVCGPHEAPLDIHLRVPWCHPEDRDGTDNDWNDCIYRVRPRMEVGKKWKGKMVKSVAFERWDGKWWIAYEVGPVANGDRTDGN